MRSLLNTLVVMTIIAIAGIAGWFILVEFINLYSKADPSLKLGVITAIGSAVAFLWNSVHQSSRERQARLFESKREAYDKFFDFFFSIFSAQKSGKPLDETIIIERFGEFTRGVMTWGSAETINAINRWQLESAKAQGKDLSTLFLPTEKMLKALRKDLGHNDATLEKHALTKLIVKAEDHDKFS